jgi:hypothetical protein
MNQIGEFGVRGMNVNTFTLTPLFLSAPVQNASITQSNTNKRYVPLHAFDTKD